MQSLHKFKQTELGMIPEGWEIKKLSDIGQIIGGGTPDTSKKDHWENGDIAWAVPTDLTPLKTNYIDKTERYITKKGLDNSAAKLLPQGAVLITSRATIGECAITTIPITTNQGFQNIICNSENNNLFLLYVIKFNKGKLVRKSHGTTFLEISKNNIKNLKLPIPPLIEQQKIVSILSKVDELIQKIKQIIEQTQRLKKGLMQRLLTKGIGHTKFKTTELGEIPEEWNIVEIDEITTKITDIDHKMPKKVESGIPFISIKYLTKYDSYYLDLIHDPELEYILEEDFKHHSKKFNAEYGDLLISRYGTIGVTKIINTQEKLIASYSIALIKPKRELIFPLFLTHTLNSDKIKKQIQSFIEQSSNTNLDLLRIKKIKVPKPSLEEQEKISSIISSLDLLVQNKRKRKFEVLNLKKGLMQQLLTGKIRVKVDKNEQQN